MNRRRFLKATAAGAVVAYGGLSTAPEWLRRAFADGSSCPASSAVPQGVDGPADCAAALARAKALGKPLLVLVIPADDGAKFARGEELGTFINNANEEQMMPLALCEVVCSTVSDLRKVVPSLGAAEPRMLLVDTSVTPPTATALDATLPPIVQANVVQANGGPGTTQRDEDATILARVAVLASLVSAAVMGDAAKLGRRVAQARAALPGEASRTEHDVSVGGPIASSRVDRAAALVAARAASASGADKTRLTSLLATAAVERLRKKPPTGAHWAHSAGCGTRIEGVQSNIAIGCGMGSVPRLAERFLYLFSVKNGAIL